MPGGKIPPDGRPAQAPGVGKNSKRHDLERPKTPGLSDSDLQQGDVQALEQGTRIVKKATQAPAKAQPATPRRQGVQRGSGDFSMQVPDPIEMAASRIGGTVPQAGEEVVVDPTPWIPMLEALASVPGASGGLVSMLTEHLANYRRKPTVSRAVMINLNDMDDILEG